MSGPVSFKSVSVALESPDGNHEAFANILKTTGVSDSTGLTFVTAAGVARADITTIGESVKNTRDDEVRCRAYSLAPEVATMWQGTTRVRRRKGEITLTFNEIQLLGAGTGDIATYAGHPLHMLIHSGLKLSSSAVAAKDVTVASSAYEFTAGTGLGQVAAQIGGLFGINIDGRSEYSAITDVDPGDPIIDPCVISHSPAFSRPLTAVAPDTIRLGENFFASDDLSLDATSSVSLRLDGVGFRTYAYGCRMTSLVASVSNERLSLAVTLTCAYVTDDHSNADVGCPAWPDGESQMLLGSYLVTGTGANDLGVAAPWAIARTDTQISSDTVSFSVTNSFAPNGRSDSIAGMSDWALMDSVSEMSYTTTEPDANLDDDELYGKYRAYLMGFAPLGAGNGLAFYIPSGFQQDDGSKRDTGGELVSQTITISAGPMEGDVQQSLSVNGLANSSFRLFMSL